MPVVISVITEKGGVGKSTLAVNLACGFGRHGFSTVLADADPQGTARDWHAVACQRLEEEGKELPAFYPVVIGADRADSLKSIVKDYADKQIIVIDTPAKASMTTAKILRLSNVALIPVGPSGPDLWAVETTVEQFKAQRELNEDLRGGFVMNKLVSNRRKTRELLEGDWNDYEVPVLKSSFKLLTAYIDSMSDGKSVYELPGEAKAEVDFLVSEILEM